MIKHYIKKTIAQMEDDSYQRALSEHFEIDKINNEEFNIYNLDNRTGYIVSLLDDLIIDCTCPHHRYRNVVCKHQIAVASEYNLLIAK